MTCLFLVAAIVAAVGALPSELPEPGQLAFILNEDDFEDYLDDWLEIEEAKHYNKSSFANPRSGKTCSLINYLFLIKHAFNKTCVQAARSELMEISGSRNQCTCKTMTTLYPAATAVRFYLAPETKW